MNLFEIGNPVITQGIRELIKDEELSNEEIIDILTRHVNGDWGELCVYDKNQNDKALETEGRIFSKYILKSKKSDEEIKI